MTAPDARSAAQVAARAPAGPAEPITLVGPATTRSPAAPIALAAPAAPAWPGLAPAPVATTTSAERRAEAVRAHRAELLGRKQLLAGGHRTDVADVLALARLSCVEDLTADLGRVRDRALARIDRARPAELAALGRSLDADLARAGDDLDRAFADRTAPGLRRLAARLCTGAPLLPVPAPDRTGPDVLRAAAPPVRPGRTVLTDPRLIGVLAGLPVLAGHGIGWSAAAVVTGLVLLAGCLVRVRAVAEHRARLAEHTARTVAAATAAGEREVARRAIRTEAAVVAALDRAVRTRRDRVRDALAVVGT